MATPDPPESPLLQGFTQFCPLPSGHVPSSAPLHSNNLWPLQTLQSLPFYKDLHSCGFFPVAMQSPAPRWILIASGHSRPSRVSAFTRIYTVLPFPSGHAVSSAPLDSNNFWPLQSLHSLSFYKDLHSFAPFPLAMHPPAPR